MPSIVRSVLAVVVGFVTIGALAFGTGALVARTWPGTLDAAGNPATDAARVAQLLYVGVFAVFGCWLAGRLAPSRPMAHALAVGVLGLFLNVASAWAVTDSHPAWYLVAGVLTTMLWAWIGGRFAEGSASSPARAVA
jgi:hypothetical protein